MDPAASCRFAVVGDVHGQFRSMVNLVQGWEAEHGTVDFVLQVGDLEPHRNEEDLSTMAAPSKHRRLGDFDEVVSGDVPLPWPVYFIGGNHEPYGWLEEHPEGFELCRNLHYLGRAGVTRIGPLRVAAVSGIHRLETFDKERPQLFEWQRQRSRSENENKQRMRGSRISNKDFIGFTGQDIGCVMASAARTDAEWELARVFSLLLDGDKHGDGCIRSSQLLPIGEALRPSDPHAEAHRLFEQMRTGEGTCVSETQFVTCFLAAISKQSDEKRDQFCADLMHRLEALRLSKSQVDVLITHDWPCGLTNMTHQQARTRPVGNGPCSMLLDEIKPALMVCGHMHTPLRCTVGDTLVRCVGKVPSEHSIAVFEMLSNPLKVHDGTRTKMIGIREVQPVDPLPLPYFAAEDSDINSDED